MVTAGTTAERLLRKLNEDKKLGIKIISARDHGESFLTLETGRQDHVEACRVVRRVEFVAARVEALRAAEEDAELLSRLRERRRGDEQKQ